MNVTTGSTTGTGPCPPHPRAADTADRGGPWAALRRLDAGLRAWLGASRLRFVLAFATVLIAGYNLRFWQETFATLGEPAAKDLLFLVALALILIVVHALLLLLAPGRRLPAFLAALLCLVAAIVAYFSDAYGVYFDKDMLRNVFQTDAAETAGLLSGRLFAWFLLLGALPATFLARVRLPEESWRQRLGTGGLAFAGGLAFVAALALGFSAHLAAFLREHKPLRYLVNPVNVIYGSVHLALADASGTRTLRDIEGPVERVAGGTGTKPLLVFLVVGETARAASFELGGYERPTNPRLSREPGVVYFSKARSCGTSTALSLPCMFSHLGRERFDAEEARYQTQLLDTLARGGVDVEWRDNNSGCKHVCDRVRHVDYREHPRGGLCAGELCFDEVMLQGLEGELRGLRRDTLIVFHQAGSHGPAYAERYPPAFETFAPTCRSPELGRCERQAVVNAYDNTILYTDHNLARQIELLKAFESEFDSLLIYVSDHGESLGENGLYLHAAPYFMAPDEQTHVPLLMWMSSGYRQRAGLDSACLRKRATAPASHDDIYHTVLAALRLRNAAYQRQQDLLASCRRGW